MLKTRIINKAQKTVSILQQKNLKIATAESCTGGLVSAYFTAVSGVSEVFELGVTSYSCRIKNSVLNVPSETLETLGAISEETAKYMAENIRKKANSDIGVSVTGVAGPDKSEGHEVGLVYIAISSNNTTVVKKLNIPPKSRDFVRQTAVADIFDLIINYVKEIWDEPFKRKQRFSRIF